MNNSPRINLKRTTIAITQRCSLKCKHCIAFMPYFENPKDMSLYDIKKSLNRYFSIVDSVGTFSITGGEPLLHGKFHEIIEAVLKHFHQIENKIDIVTNGTIKMKTKTLDLLQSNFEKFRIIVSDYGKLSTNIDILIQSLDERNIEYRVAKYYGEDLIYNGWVDLSDHSQKYFSKKKIDENALKCIFRQGKYYVITDGQLHACSRSAWRMRIDAIPTLENQIIDLLDISEDINLVKQKLIELDDRVSLTSCAFCKGVNEKSERIMPAQQL